MSYYGAVERAGLIGTILARPCCVMTILGTISEGVSLRGRGTYSPVWLTSMPCVQMVWKRTSHRCERNTRRQGYRLEHCD
jgi:hypothetical protein